MDYGPIGFIKAILETLGDSINPEQRKKIGSYFREGKTSSFSPQALAEAREMAESDPGEQYWKELFMEMLEEDEKERAIISEMMIEDYEARHEAESGDDLEVMDSAGEETEQQADSSQDADSEPSSEGESSIDSGRYDGYIG